LLGGAACGSSAPGMTTNDAGADLPAERPRPTIALTPGDSLFEVNSGILRLIVTNVAGACTYTMNGQVKAGGRALAFNLLKTPVAGTYAVNEQTMPAQAYFQSTDDACHPQFAIMPFARSGTLVIDAISATDLTGSYDVTFAGGQNLTGTFHATKCGALSQLNPTCVP